MKRERITSGGKVTGEIRCEAGEDICVVADAPTRDNLEKRMEHLVDVGGSCKNGGSWWD